MSPFWTEMVCRDNAPSWLGPSLLVGDNTQAQGRFSCECLPDHHWDSTGEEEKTKNTVRSCKRQATVRKI